MSYLQSFLSEYYYSVVKSVHISNYAFSVFFILFFCTAVAHIQLAANMCSTFSMCISFDDNNQHCSDGSKIVMKEECV